MLQPLRSLAASGRVDTDHEHSGARITPLCRGKSRGVLLTLNTALFTRISTPPRSTPETDTSKRPWHSVPSWPPHVTRDEMVAAMDTVSVDGANLISTFDLYQYDASRRRRRARKRQPSGVRRCTQDCNRPPANPTLPRCLKATATVPRAARASTASRRRSTPCILQP